MASDRTAAATDRIVEWARAYEYRGGARYKRPMMNLRELLAELDSAEVMELGGTLKKPDPGTQAYLDFGYGQ